MAITRLNNNSITSITALPSGVGGVTMADQWRLTANIEATNADITSNLERIDTGGFAQLGTGMTNSSGIFSFPSTGIYLIVFHARLVVASGDSGFIYASSTTNNSSYVNTAYVFETSGTGSGGGTDSASFIFDVTNVSTHKVKFTTVSLATDSYVVGNSSETATGFTFIKLGET